MLMMSLFSPFDLYFFSKSTLMIFFVISTIFLVSYKISMFNYTLNYVNLNLSSFFYTLKLKSFCKFSILFFLTIFMMVCFINFFSVFSYFFPLTSQVSIMMMVSFSIWFSMILFSFSNSTKKALYHFIPEGSPLSLSFVLFLIEVVSNVIRPITLMVRLVANILAGHLLMTLLSKLVFMFQFVFPLYMILNLVEIFVALIQAYIFVTMLTLYYSEV